MKKNKNRILTLVVILTLLGLVYAQPTTTVMEKVLGGLGGLADFVFKPDNAKTLYFLGWLWLVVSSAKENFSNIKAYVLINPDPLNPEMLKVIGFFISLAQMFYVLAIVATGFYLLFISGSLRGRTRAKYMLGRLVIGMFLVSISPFLLKFLFQFSSSFTYAIFEQTDISPVTDEFNDMLDKVYIANLGFIAPSVLNTLISKFKVREKVMEKTWGRLMGRLYPETLWLYAPNWLKNLGSYLSKFIGEFKIGSPGMFGVYAYFMIIIVLILTFGVLAFRYLMLILWTILFPLSIFFTTFSLTRNIGRTMMEQTLQWTFFQIFYALSLVGLSIGFVILPEGYEGYNMFFIGFHSIAMIVVLLFGPWYLSSLLQRIFPP